MGLAGVEPLRIVDCGLKTIGIKAPYFPGMGKADVGKVRSKIRNDEANAGAIP